MQALLERREARAFDQLYTRHTPALHALALRLLGGDAATAEDVVHDAWVRAIERLASFRWEAAFRTWLSAFVVNLVRERGRRAGRDHEIPDDGLPVEDLRLRGAFDRVDLERAIAALPGGFREVLVLHDIEGYTHDEIASLLGIVVGTSKSQLARARAALRRSLVPEGT